MNKIRSFMDLDAWRKGHSLVLFVYKLISLFPKNENYALSDQLRRASVSITSNIAEGFSRRSNKEKVQFFYLSLGSLTEVQSQMIIAFDLKYIDDKNFVLISKQLLDLNKLIKGLIRSARLQKYNPK